MWCNACERNIAHLKEIENEGKKYKKNKNKRNNNNREKGAKHMFFSSI